MSAEAITPDLHLSLVPPLPNQGESRNEQLPLFAVPGEGLTAEKPQSLQLLDRFFDTRAFAEEHPGARDERLTAIREDVRQWFNSTYPDIASGKPGTSEDYARVAGSAGESMTGKLIDYLMLNHMQNGVSWPEIVASGNFLEANFAIKEDVENGVDLSQGKDTHAFIVPVRLSTGDPEYTDEIRPLVRVYTYVPDELVPHFMRDLPAFVADRYSNGGNVVVAAITDDMRQDLLAKGATPAEQAAFFSIGRNKVNNAVDTGAALGAKEFGYGATLPGLMKWGRATRNKDVRTTTGHGGTTAIMSMLIDKVVEQVPEERRKHLRVGMLGLGKIGLPAAQVIAELHPDMPINVYDPVESHMAHVVNQGEDGRFTAREDATDLIANSDIILSTATAAFSFTDPGKENYLEFGSLEGKWFIDDSEPHSLQPHEVMDLGGVAIEVVGRDYSGNTMRRVTDFAYGHTLANAERDGFGCEMEVAALHRLRKEMEGEGRPKEEIAATLGQYALSGPASAENTRLWISLFKRYGIGPAPFQAFGKAHNAAAQLASV